MNTMEFFNSRHCSRALIALASLLYCVPSWPLIALASLLYCVPSSAVIQSSTKLCIGFPCDLFIRVKDSRFVIMDENDSFEKCWIRYTIPIISAAITRAAHTIVIIFTAVVWRLYQSVKRLICSIPFFSNTLKSTKWAEEETPLISIKFLMAVVPRMLQLRSRRYYPIRLLLEII